MGVLDFLTKDRRHDGETEELKYRRAANLFHRALHNQITRFGITAPDNLEEIVNYYQNNSIIYTLMDWKARKGSMVKPNIFKVKSKSDAKEHRKWNGLYMERYEKLQLKQLANIAFDEIDMMSITESSDYWKLKQLLTHPNPDNTFAEFIGGYLSYMDGCGYSLMWSRKVRGGVQAGRSSELYLLPGHIMSLHGSEYKPIEGYSSYKFPTNEKDFKAKDTMHVKTFSFKFDGLGTEQFGTSKISVAMKEVLTYSEALNREYYAFKTGDTATILSPKDPARLPSEMKSSKGLLAFADTVRKALKQKDRHKVAILNTALEGIKIDSQLKDSRTLESKKEIREILAAVWHLSNRVVLNSSEGSTFNNVKEETKTSLRDGVFPDLIKFSEAFNDFEMSPNYAGHELVWDFDVFPELEEERKSMMSSLAGADFLSDNQKLAELGYATNPNKLADIPDKYWPQLAANSDETDNV
jgi:hypothetical protein